MKFIRASAFTGSWNSNTSELEFMHVKIYRIVTFLIWHPPHWLVKECRLKVLTTLGVSRAGRNRVRKYGLRKIL